jgi:hypothetical protein
MRFGIAGVGPTLNPVENRLRYISFPDIRFILQQDANLIMSTLFPCTDYMLEPRHISMTHSHLQVVYHIKGKLTLHIYTINTKEIKYPGHEYLINLC